MLTCRHLPRRFYSCSVFSSVVLISSKRSFCSDNNGNGQNDQEPPASNDSSVEVDDFTIPDIIRVSPRDLCSVELPIPSASESSSGAVDVGDAESEENIDSHKNWFVITQSRDKNLVVASIDRSVGEKYLRQFGAFGIQLPTTMMQQDGSSSSGGTLKIWNYPDRCGWTHAANSQSFDDDEKLEYRRHSQSEETERHQRHEPPQQTKTISSAPRNKNSRASELTPSSSISSSLCATATTNTTKALVTSPIATQIKKLLDKNYACFAKSQVELDDLYAKLLLPDIPLKQRIQAQKKIDGLVRLQLARKRKERELKRIEKRRRRLEALGIPVDDESDAGNSFDVQKIEKAGAGREDSADEDDNDNNQNQNKSSEHNERSTSFNGGEEKNSILDNQDITEALLMVRGFGSKSKNSSGRRRRSVVDERSDANDANNLSSGRKINKFARQTDKLKKEQKWRDNARTDPLYQALVHQLRKEYDSSFVK